MRRGPVLVGTVLLLLALAGCVGPFGSGPSTGTAAPPGTTPTTGPGTGGTPGANGPMSTATPATATMPANLSADNPFGQAVVPVRVNDTVEDGRNTTALVATAIDYWNARIQRYTPFDYRFVLAEDPANARVEVRFVDTIEECGRDHDVRTVGCAPLYEAGDTAPEVVVARVEIHGSNSAVVGTIEHELGHVLGLDHDDEPLLIMGAAVETAVADASERAVPWYTNELSVYVDYDSLAGDRATISDQIGHAIEYYNEGAGGTIPENVTFTRTDHLPSADIVISNSEQYRCGGLENAWAAVSKGPARIDTDAGIEVYTRQIICVDVGEEAFGWAVAKGLGDGMGLKDSEFPPPLRDDSYGNTHSDWWE